MSEAKDALVGALTVVGLFGFFGMMIYLNDTSDATPGLTYESGDRPHESNRAICYGPGVSSCPRAHLRWTIAAGGSVTTRFTVDGTERSLLSGGLRVGDACRTVVDWEITTPGRTIARNTVRPARSGEQYLHAQLMAEERVVTFTARRTDGESCPAILLWYSAGASEW